MPWKDLVNRPLALHMMKTFVFLVTAAALILGYYLHQESPGANWGAGGVLSAKLASEFTSEVSVLQNFTLSDRTLITILKPRSEKWQVRLSSESGELAHDQVSEKRTPINSSFEIMELDLRNLRSGVAYGLEVADSQNKILDAREFQSLDTTKKNPSIAVASCARVGWLGKDFGPRSIWDELQDQQPDALLFLGDMVYPDTAFQATFHIKPTDQQIEDKYIEAWQEVRLYHQFKLLPVFTVMDDHDYGFQGANSKNNSDRQDQMLKFFRSFYPIPSEKVGSIFERGVGASFRVELFGMNVFLLDNKYARTASNETGEEGPIWGQEQLDWLGDRLAVSEKESLIGSGTLFTFPKPNQDAAEYESPAEFASLQKSLKRSRRKFILMSGDVHYSAVQKLSPEKYGFSSYEIIASRIHSISPIIIPPFISGYVGPELGQSLHTSEKNFTLLHPSVEGLEGTGIEIYVKNEKVPLKTRLSL